MRWISSLDIHPSGDHLIVGGYDRKVCWFDLELSSKPYKVLRCVSPLLGLILHLTCSHFMSLQVSFPCNPLRSISPLVPAVCIIVGRRHGASVPCTGVQRLDDGPAHRAAEGVAGTRREGRSGSIGCPVESGTPVVAQRRRGRSCRCVVRVRRKRSGRARGIVRMYHWICTNSRYWYYARISVSQSTVANGLLKSLL